MELMDARGTCDGRHRARKHCPDPECYLKSDPPMPEPSVIGTPDGMRAYQDAMANASHDPYRSPMGAEAPDPEAFARADAAIARDLEPEGRYEQVIAGKLAAVVREDIQQRGAAAIVEEERNRQAEPQPPRGPAQDPDWQLAQLQRPWPGDRVDADAAPVGERPPTIDEQVAYFVDRAAEVRSRLDVRLAELVAEESAKGEPIAFGPGIYRWACTRDGGYQRTEYAHALPPAPEGWRWSSAQVTAVGGRGKLHVSAAVVDGSEGANAATGPQSLVLEITGRGGYCTGLDVVLFARPR